MIEKAPSRVGNPVLVSVAAFVVIVAGLRAAQEIVVPFLVAAFLTLLSLPTLHSFQRKRFPTWLALVVMTATIVLVGLVLVGVVGSSVNELRLQLPAYQERVASIQANLDDWLQKHGIDAGVKLDEQLFDSKRILSLFGDMLGALGSLLNNALIIVFMLVFMQLEAAEVAPDLPPADHFACARAHIKN